MHKIIEGNAGRVVKSVDDMQPGEIGLATDNRDWGPLIMTDEGALVSLEDGIEVHWDDEDTIELLNRGESFTVIVRGKEDITDDADDADDAT